MPEKIREMLQKIFGEGKSEAELLEIWHNLSVGYGWYQEYAKAFSEGDKSLAQKYENMILTLLD